mgnify:CR=1 FL=1
MKYIKGMILTLVAVCSLTVFFGIPQVSYAQSQDYGLKKTADKAFGPNSPITAQNRTIYSVVGQILNVVLGLLGIIFLILIVYGGISWMVAGGDQDKVKSARNVLSNAIIGLALVLVSYALSFFVLNALITAITTN